ncbi:S41 family peptidase [Maribellus sediminis]|uniref:S41 family peptidase n=1 Tax=Maribellus sediminis TaxID=2696285 RepID=UPI001431AC57|nr:S41 family peptidase [Maribellus sediminis]
MKTGIVIFTLLILSVNTKAQELSDEAWREDLKSYQTGLEDKHIDLYNKISKAEFEKALAKIEASTGTETDLGIILDLMRLTRKIGDGHTAVSARNLGFHHYPFEVKNFEGDWRLVKVAKEHSNLLGLKLVGVENKNIDSVIKKLGEVVQFVENEQSLIVRTAENITSAELLYALKISKEKTQASFTFSDDSGNKTSVKLTALTQQEYYEETAFTALSVEVPQIAKPKKAGEANFWYAPILGTKALYIHFESYPAFEEMMKIGEALVGYISENSIRQLVIDLRNNGGGDLYTGLVLAYALNLADPVDWKNGVYVLADKVTFSAATSNTALFRELLNAKIVGEPTGSNPTGYQDMDTFELPNSKLVICYSKRLFQVQEIPTSGVQPEILLKYEWESFSKGKDNMLKWVINELKQQP